ncbi:DUF2516 family protein [Arcanobacterium haemolyticum]|nr:DUF2516 family protein [Arcanobacterium haemolyticum]
MISLVVGLAMIGLLAWALFEAIRRPSSMFALARLPKNTWIIILVVGLLVVGNGTFWWFPFPFMSILRFAGLIAAVYFLGPECQRMGPRRGRGDRPRRTRGGW